MNKLHTLTLGLILVLVFLQSQSKAWSPELTLTAGDYNIPDHINHPELIGLNVLNTLNEVTITMLGQGGGAIRFNMYDNSKFTMNGPVGNIGELNLYDNAAASLYGGGISSIFVDSESTGWVKLYAVEIAHYIPPWDPENQELKFYWLGDSPANMHIINLIGTSTYSHIQFVPEPATLAMIGIGILALRRRK